MAPPHLREDDVLSAPPATAQCAGCETGIVLAGGRLPPGWRLIDGQALCPDCWPARAGAPLHVIGADTTATRHRGCRVGHEVAFGTVALRIHAGPGPRRASLDAPVQFMLGIEELDELIERLEAIRAEVAASLTEEQPCAR